MPYLSFRGPFLLGFHMRVNAGFQMDVCHMVHQWCKITAFYQCTNIAPFGVLGGVSREETKPIKALLKRA
jgi:hypothetical protein